MSKELKPQSAQCGAESLAADCSADGSTHCFNPFSGNNNDLEDGRDVGNEWRFALKLAEHNIQCLIRYENYFCLS